MALFREDQGALKCRFLGENLWLLPWGKNALRVVSRPMSEPELPAWALLEPEKTESDIEISEREASIAVGKIKAVVRRMDWPDRLEITCYNQKGEELLAERPGTGALNIQPRFFKPIVGGDYKLTVGFKSDDSEKLYGMGQYQQDILNVKYSNFELAHRNSQASVPFVLSNKGYGFLWHNPAIGRANFGKNLMEWQADVTRQMDYWICAGDTPRQIESQYADAVGHAPEMPEYGLGFWQCKLRYWNQEQLLSVAREYHKRGIPVDVIVVDFFHWPHMGDFRFDEEFWPDPKAMVKELKAMGMELMVSIWPQISLKSENFKEMDEEGYIARCDKGMTCQMRFVDEDVMFFDATNPDARKYLWSKIKKNYYNNGVRVFWLDEAEPEYGTYDFDNYRYHSGTVAQTGNIYPQVYARTFYDGQKSEGQEKVVNLLRCAWAGSARYGALVWSGDIHSDFDTLRRQVRAGLNMGVAGIPWWTTDIGGFAGGDPKDETFRELIVRWFEWGTFCPVMRLHGNRVPDEHIFRKNGQEVLPSGADNEIWSFGETAYGIIKKLIDFRELMRPYTRQVMQEAHESGAPVMRTMFYEFPEDARCWDLEDQYLFGSDVLVAPVCEQGAVQREVYLPAGAQWTDIHTGKAYDGGQIVACDCPLDKIPVFLKNGSHPDWIGKL